MNSTEAANIDVVRKYFDGCQSGDLEILLSTLAPDVVHFFSLYVSLRLEAPSIWPNIGENIKTRSIQFGQSTKSLHKEIKS